MKKSFFAILSFVFLLSCHRDPLPTEVSFEFTQVKADAHPNSCDISCQNISVQSNENVHARLVLSLRYDLSAAEMFPMEENDSCLTCHVSDLKNGTLYYFTFEAYTNDDYTRSNETFNFSTKIASSIVTGDVTEVSTTTAKCDGKVFDIDGVTVMRRGVCWSTERNPTTNDHHLSNGNSFGEFTIAMRNLSSGTRYFARAYIITSTGTEYGGEVSFVTQNNDLPEIVTSHVTDITPYAAVGHGQVITEGASPVTERGVCWSTAHDPLASDSHQSAGAGIGSFSAYLPDLTPNATYYLRAYATNEKGTAYGAEVSFTASEGQPEVETVSVTYITTTTAIGYGRVVAQGGSSITDRGLCWSLDHNPSTDDSHISAGMGMGEFNVDIAGLLPSTTYYLRAYATNDQGTTYGSEVRFSTLRLPDVSTIEVANITDYSAKVFGNVVSQGDGVVMDRGICWSVEHNPTINDCHLHSGNGEGEFSCILSGLSQGVTYYARAYATNDYGTAYGDEMVFTALVVPVVITSDVVNIMQTSAQGGGQVISDGDIDITEWGLCWSTEQFPTIDNSYQASENGLESFVVNMSNLHPIRTYYVRAYAMYDGFTIYGNQVCFTTLPNPPNVITNQVSNITHVTAKLSGKVTSGGGASPEYRGICWSTNHNPTIDDFDVIVGSGVGVFSILVTGLIPSTTYYVRAYAVNDAGLAYGNEVSFTTNEEPEAECFMVSGVQFKMIRVEGGTFTMGGTPEQGSYANSDELPTHSVTLNDFSVGETEVTQALWQAVMGSNPSYFKGNNLPVERVSWDNCQAFINQLNTLLASQLGGRHFALPTEAEWEYAARGGKRSLGYRYSGSDDRNDVAWYVGNSDDQTHNVAQKQPNELGCFDMSGNVSEWCADWYGDYNGNAQINPSGPDEGSGRVCRGGTWKENFTHCRVSCRRSNYPNSFFNHIGFRLLLR